MKCVSPREMRSRRHNSNDSLPTLPISWVILGAGLRAQIPAAIANKQLIPAGTPCKKETESCNRPLRETFALGLGLFLVIFHTVVFL